MDLNTQFQKLFNYNESSENKIDLAISICTETSISFAEWIIEKHKQYPDSVIRCDKLFYIFQKEKQNKKQSMLSPKEKANELFKKISLLMELEHIEILEVLDFLIETKVISNKVSSEEKKYWELVRIEAKKIK